VNLEAVEWGILNSRIKSSSLQFTLAWRRWIGDYLDPATFLELYSFGNGGNYNSERYEALLDKAKKTLKQEERFAILHEAEDVLMEDMPCIPLYFMTISTMSKDYVIGYKKNPLGNLYLKDLDINLELQK
jgi:oligopeptide transport system substrate-binding protein